MKRSRLSPVSKKRKAALTIYYAKRTIYLKTNKLCRAKRLSCTTYASQVHHIARRGPNLNNVATWLPVCPNCHRWIETNANEARALGLLK